MRHEDHELLFALLLFQTSLLESHALGYNTSVVKRRRALSWLFLFIGLANLVRAALAQQVAPALEEWSLTLPLTWLTVLYSFWGLGFCGASFALSGFGRHKDPRWTLPFALAYELTLWALALSSYRAAYARALWGRDLLLTVLFLVTVAFLSRRKT